MRKFSLPGGRVQGAEVGFCGAFFVGHRSRLNVEEAGDSGDEGEGAFAAFFDLEVGRFYGEHGGALGGAAEGEGVAAGHFQGGVGAVGVS